MSHEYCTLFDHRYLAHGLAMIRSLRRVASNSTVWVLCLDEIAQDILSRFAEPGVRTVSLAALEARDSSLAAVRYDGRSLVEYYFTCKASLIAYVLQASPDAEMISYLDADLWFFANPAPMFEETDNAAVILTPHRFPPRRMHLNAYGSFNAGWLSFHRCQEGLACLDWWRSRCLEWCRDHVDEENQRFADQRYLDRFPTQFPGTHAVRHKGANLAPWNVGAHRLDARDNLVLIDGEEPLLFFHFHGIRPISQNFYALPAHGGTRMGLQGELRRHVYGPYLRELRCLEREIAPLLPRTAAQPLRYLPKSKDPKLVLMLRTAVRFVRAVFCNSLIRVAN